MGLLSGPPQCFLPLREREVGAGNWEQVWDAQEQIEDQECGALLSVPLPLSVRG